VLILFPPSCTHVPSGAQVRGQGGGKRGKKMFRIGHGYDLHCIVAGESLTLGGINIPCAYQIVAHSDGDVVLHAICDALLGAIAQGIGQHFSDTDTKNAKRDSREFLKYCWQLVQAAGYQLGNIDVTVIAQVPKLASHIVAMRTAIAKELATDIMNISVKATTNEGVDAIGRKEAIAVHVVVLLVKN
jgi:2-C-methyl-D-erythritol 2,4-cyclodiphosphate synthase